MPLYEYSCPEHGYFDRYLPVSDYDKPQNCPCGKEAKKLLSTPMVHVKQDVNYASPIDGRPITSWKQRQEDMKRSGCVEYDPGVKQDYQKRIQQDEKALDTAVDQTVESAFEKMPIRKKELLQSELASGANPEVVRSTPPQQSFRG